MGVAEAAERVQRKLGGCCHGGRDREERRKNVGEEEPVAKRNSTSTLVMREMSFYKHRCSVSHAEELSQPAEETRLISLATYYTTTKSRMKRFKTPALAKAKLLTLSQIAAQQSLQV